LSCQYWAVVMKKFVLLLLALVGLPASLMLLSMPGCSNPCADLRDLCNTDCADTNYEDACRSVADGNNESLCSGQLAGFRSNCSVIPNVGGAPATPESCDNGQVLCSGSDGALCVSLNSNPKYCGACNNDCTKNVAGEGGSAAEAKTKCAAGSCVSECPAALPKNCSDACVDFDTDPNNCGECGNGCETDAPLCSAGDCVASCAKGEAECDGSCTDLATDPLNCGACSNVCGAGQLCSNGGCASSCAEGLTECSGKCVDANTDPLNCGACAGAGSDGSGGAGGGATAITGTCPASAPKCSDGECAKQCAAGQIECPDSSGSCVDATSNVQHCGDCFNLCAEGEKCSSGSCVSGCGETETECGSTCAKLDTDPKNCGGCGNGCSASQVCSQGVCKTACDSGLTNCGGSCVDLSSHPDHCKTCNSACPSATPKCSNSACVTECGTGLTDCSNHCINLTKDNFFHCGSCNNSCGDQSVCTADSCVDDTENSSFKCQNFSVAANCTDDNPCTDDKCDAKTGCSKSYYTVAEWAAICAGPNGDTSTCYVCVADSELKVQTDACKTMAEAGCEIDMNNSSCLDATKKALCEGSTTVTTTASSSDSCCQTP
jgi:hypothetical protein